MVSTNVEFFNKDARDVFLEPKSVDLFLIHPPFFGMLKNQYGGESDLQTNYTNEKKEFVESMTKYLNNMSDALSDDGNILFILPNHHSSIKSISDIANNTDLVVYNIIMWNFENTKGIKGDYKANLILHIRKNTNFDYRTQKLKSFVINKDWTTDDELLEYNGLGFIHDGFPLEISDTLIEAFSEEGDVVADIFAGTGTTIVSALKNNRKAIYNDVSEVQLEVAKKRVSDILRVLKS